MGSCAAFALHCAGLVAKIQLLDASKDLADGEALDLLDGSAFAGDQKIHAGDSWEAIIRYFECIGTLNPMPIQNPKAPINSNVSRVGRTHSTRCRVPHSL